MAGAVSDFRHLGRPVMLPFYFGRPIDLLAVDFGCSGCLKPEMFDGTASKFRDWAIVFRSYASLANPIISVLMKEAEAYTGAPDEQPITNVSLTETKATASRDLYHLLLSLCRGVALEKVINATDGERALAWSMLSSRYEPKLKTRQAGLFMTILKFDFSGDVLARIETFERERERERVCAL